MFYINRKSKKSKKAILSNKKSSTIKSMANLILGSYTLSVAMIFFLYCIQFSDYTKSCLNNEFITSFSVKEY